MTEKKEYLLNLPARYYRMYLEAKPYGCSEEDFQYVEKQMRIATSESALILVDCWNVHYCESWLSRAKKIIEDKIVPVVNASREVALTIVHAPSSIVAKKYPQSERYFQAGDEEKAMKTAPVDPEWPPEGFVRRRDEDSRYARMAFPPRETYKVAYRDMMIADPLAPKPEDYVVRSGSQLHRILKNLKKIHLLYAGFATNMCLVNRDYGMRAMRERGYNLVLLRDCTTGVEFHDTFGQLLLTEAFIKTIELKYAFSTTSKEFIVACMASRQVDATS